jgi:hypothetical protein
MKPRGANGGDRHDGRLCHWFFLRVMLPADDVDILWRGSFAGDVRPLSFVAPLMVPGTRYRWFAE